MGCEKAKEHLTEQLVIVHNDIFNHLSQYATPVVPHVQLTEQKTSDNLWYEESLPPDTLLYSALVMQKSRKGNQTAQDLMDTFSKLLTSENYLQIGGNETTGMGWCRITLPEMNNENI